MELTDDAFVRGSICTVDGEIDLDASVVVAEVYSKATRQDDRGLVGCYFLAHGLTAEEAEEAMMFFMKEPSLLVDAGALVDDAGAEFPALVVIRYSDETTRFLATMHEFGILRELPSNDVVRPEGWRLFWAMRALERGEEIPEAAALQEYDYRALRRKVLALRCSVYEDRDPWLQAEYDDLRRLTKGNPEGSEAFVAHADDIEAAMEGRVAVGDRFSVVIPTKVERQRPVGAIVDWVPQAGREIVVAHGLDAIQAARSLAIVKANKEAFVSAGNLARGAAREHLCEPIVVPDSALNWISADLTGRRSTQGYERLRAALAAHDAGVAPARTSIGR